MEHAKLHQTPTAIMSKKAFAFHKVTSVVPLDNYLLDVTFEDGSLKEYDVKPLFTKWSAFDALRVEPGLFHCVKIETGGYAISWNDAIDLSCNELWDNGRAK
jgi:hypothetical protein